MNIRRPGESRYTVRILEITKKISVICPICHHSFEIKKFGIVKCSYCKSKLEYKEIK